MDVDGCQGQEHAEDVKEFEHIVIHFEAGYLETHLLSMCVFLNVNNDFRPPTTLQHYLKEFTIQQTTSRDTKEMCGQRRAARTLTTEGTIVSKDSDKH